VMTKLLMIVSYGMRLNGAILEGPDLVSFCDIRRRSYMTTPQHRSITPPPVQPPSSSSGRSLSSWTSWAADPEDIVDYPLSSVAPSSSAFDPWIVNPEDTQDNTDARAVTPPESREYLDGEIKCFTHFISSQARCLG
jgi:hypothetical protein